MNAPTDLEVKNAQEKILPMLTDISDISVQQTRDDIFVVTEHETNYNFSIIVDVEPSTVCLILEVMDVPDGDLTDMMHFMLLKNNDAVHGKYCIGNGKILIRDNLEIDNVDQNELEASLSHMFFMVSKDFKRLLSYGHIIDESDSDGIEDADDVVDIENIVEVATDALTEAVDSGVSIFDPLAGKVINKEDPSEEIIKDKPESFDDSYNRGDSLSSGSEYESDISDSDSCDCGGCDD